jgi:membrane-associated phospholipid phosphatase
MSDKLILGESEQIPPEPYTTPRPLHVSVARHTSNVLSPFVVSFPFILLVAFYHTSNPLHALWFAAVTLFFLSIGPMVYIVIGVLRGKLTDVDVSLRTQRFGPFLFGLCSALLGLLALMFIHSPKNLQTVLLITLLTGIIMTVITFWWKISIHASSMAGAVTMLTALYGSIVLPASLLIIAVCWSRVVLRRHTLAQVIAGSLLSIALSSIVLVIRGV